MPATDQSTCFAIVRIVPFAALLAAVSPLDARAAEFVISDGDTITTSQTLNAGESGRIQPGGHLDVSGLAISAAGADVQIDSRGAISTTGDYSVAIHSTGANACIDLGGTVTTAGDGSNGVNLNGNDTSLTSAAAITTAGNYSGAIHATGNRARIDLGGTITTAGDGSTGVSLHSDDARLSSTGAITTAGDYSGAIQSTGDTARIDLDGTITTTGDGSTGVSLYGDDARLVSTGAITTAGDYARAIQSAGDTARIDLGGTITTTGDGSTGVSLYGDDARLISTGAITTAGDYSDAIQSTGANARIDLGGTITTSGYRSNAVTLYDDEARIDNSGSIRTTGVNANGINSDGDNAVINHSGLIAVSGVNAIAISSNGSGGVINVSGRIVASADATDAIIGHGNLTLNLLPGATIIGRIDLGPGTNAVNVVRDGTAPSRTLSIGNAGTIRVSGAGAAFVSGDTISLIDTSALRITQQSLELVSSRIFQGLNQQLNRAAALPEPITVTTTQLSADMWPHEQPPMGWGQVFGGVSRHVGDAAGLAYEAKVHGVLGGYERRLGAHRAGLFGGISHVTASTDTRSIHMASDSLFAGAYGQYAQAGWRLNGALALGYAHHDGKRLVVDNLYGAETATARYEAVSISPSMALTRIVDIDSELSIRPSVELNYTHAWLNSHREHGTTRSNLSVGRRKASVMTARLILAAHQRLANHGGEVEIRGGLSHHQDGDDAVSLRLQDASAIEHGPGGGSATGEFVGANYRISWSQAMTLVGDVEYTHDHGVEQTIVGSLGLAYRF